MFIIISRTKFALFSISLGILLLGAGTAAKADTMAYFENAVGQFGTIDLNNGNITDIGATNILGGTNGFGVANGNLYAIYTTGAAQLYSINTGTGVATFVGSAAPGVGYNPLGSTSQGLLAYSGGNLVSLNPNTAAATVIGPTPGSGSALAGPFPIFSTSSDSSSLYEINAGTGATGLYFGTVNTSNGTGTLENAHLNGYNYVMMEENGTLYALLQYDIGGDFTAYTINTTTGVATQYGDGWTMNTSGTGWISALAPDPLTSSVPGPATILLLAPGLAGLIGFKRKYRG